jgi:hypothetical protein
MRFSTSAAYLFAAVLLAGHDASAQERTPVEAQLGFDLITGRIQNVAAEQAGTGTRAWGGQATGAVTAYRVLALTGEFGIVDMRDGRQFSQETNKGTMSSAVSAFLGTVAAGLRTPPLALAESDPLRLGASVSVGHTWIKTERMITQCAGCRSEDVELRAGDFLEPALYVTRGRGGLNARYRMYRDGSHWENAVIVGYTLRMRGRAAAPDKVPAEPEAQ